jgi:hypothetical protein
MFYLKEIKIVPFHLCGNLISFWTVQVWLQFHGFLQMNPCVPMKEIYPYEHLQI